MASDVCFNDPGINVVSKIQVLTMRLVEGVEWLVRIKADLVYGVFFFFFSHTPTLEK